jgi:hypothetical protein
MISFIILIFYKYALVQFEDGTWAVGPTIPDNYDFAIKFLGYC